MYTLGEGEFNKMPNDTYWHERVAWFTELIQMPKEFQSKRSAPVTGMGSHTILLVCWWIIYVPRHENTVLVVCC